MPDQEFIALNRITTEEISERITKFQMLYITEGVDQKCDLTNLSLDNLDFANLCGVATKNAVRTLSAIGRTDEIGYSEERLEELEILAEHLDFSNSIGSGTSFRMLDLTHSVLKNTFFTKPDFRNASQFFTLDVNGAH